MVPKAELHLHLEGAISPARVRKLAKRNHLSIPEEIFKDEHSFNWRDFLDFLHVYDIASSVIRTPEDYYDITYDYLSASAKQGVIYAELMPSSDHAQASGLSYQNMLDAIVAAMEQAKLDHDIEARILVSCVRHFGLEKCIAVAEDVVRHPHPLVVGFGMGGNEADFPPAQFAPAYAIAHEAGLQCNVHAGEHVGPEGVWEAIDHLPVKRIGHGVRSIEDADLIQALIERDISLEVSPGSNIALGVYPDYASHPFLQLRDAGVKVTLNSDDPPHFATTIGNEYDQAQAQFGLNDAELIDITRTAIEVSFADAETKTSLLDKLNQ